MCCCRLILIDVSSLEAGGCFIHMFFLLTFSDNKLFMLYLAKSELKQKYSLIMNITNIIVTHRVSIVRI